MKKIILLFIPILFLATSCAKDSTTNTQNNNSIIPLTNAPTRQPLTLSALRLVQLRENAAFVEITWDKNITEKYELYRSKGSQTNWQKIKDLDNVMYSLVDNLVKSGTGTYYYKITAVDASGKVIQESSVSSITISFPNYDEEAQKPFQKNDTYDYFGTLTLTGYLKVEKRVCNPGDMCEKTRDYASFVFSQTSSKAIYDFLGTNEGNAFVQGKGVGIGCYEKDASRIYSQNEGDDGMVENIITGNNLQSLLNSNEKNPIKLQLTKPIYTSGRGAPDCYSHFRNFNVIN